MYSRISSGMSDDTLTKQKKSAQQGDWGPRQFGMPHLKGKWYLLSRTATTNDPKSGTNNSSC